MSSPGGHSLDWPTQAGRVEGSSVPGEGILATQIPLGVVACPQGLELSHLALSAVLAGISAQLAEDHVAKQRLKCKELWQCLHPTEHHPWVCAVPAALGAAGLTVLLCFQTVLFLTLLADDPRGHSGGLAVPCLSLGP